MVPKRIAVAASVGAVILASAAYMNRYEYVRVPTGFGVNYPLDAVVRINRFTNKACVLPSQVSKQSALLTCDDLFGQDNMSGEINVSKENIIKQAK